MRQIAKFSVEVEMVATFDLFDYGPRPCLLIEHILSGSSGEECLSYGTCRQTGSIEETVSIVIPDWRCLKS